MSKAFIYFSFFILFSSLTNAQQWGLYTLYAPTSGTTAYLVDTNDITYKTWTFSSNKKTGYSTYLISGDTIVRSYIYIVPSGLEGGGATGGVQKILWDGTVVWDFQYSSPTYILHHDICPMPNGNVLMIAWELRTSAEAIQAGASDAYEFMSEKLIEVHPTSATTGNIVWEWKLWDHLCQNYDSSKNNYVSSILNNPQLLDINYRYEKEICDRWHMNGVDYNQALDQIVVSIHTKNSVFVIDHSTTTFEASGHTGGNSGKGGDFIYRWGNPNSYDASGATVFNIIHDAHWISSDNPKYPNYLCAYNNLGGLNDNTAIDIWEPPYDDNNYSLTLGQAYGPATYSYQYNSTFSSPNTGNSQQLSNGNMLVNNGNDGILEVDSAGNILWSKSGTYTAHAYRYSKCYVRGPIAKASYSVSTVCEGAPFNLGSSATSVTETNPSYTYFWTSDQSGFTSLLQNPSVIPVAAGIYTYQVIITDTIIKCSDTAFVTVNVISCEGTDETSELKDHEITFPNPSKGIINFNESVNYSNAEILLYNAYGDLLMRTSEISTLDISSYANGVYFIVIKTDNKKIINKKVILIK